MKNFQMKVPALKNEKFNIEKFKSADELVEVCRTRKVTDGNFHDYDKGFWPDVDWVGGVKSYKEALELLHSGYQPTVEKLKDGLKATFSGSGKRIHFENDIVGYAPIVPLALMGVPNAMQNSHMKPIKNKVVDIYYSMTAGASVDAEDIVKAGQKLLASIIDLEMQGYRFNLYAVQEYYGDGKGADMLCVKVKSADKPIDLKRVSFPLTHPAFFRAIGFDWYSKTPNGKYRFGYGRPIGSHFNEQQLQDGFKQMFGKNAVYFSCAKILRKDMQHIRDAIVASEKSEKKKEG